MFLDEGDEIALELFAPAAGRWPRWPSCMARDLAGPGVTIADALTAVAGVLPAIEIVDSRIADWRMQARRHRRRQRLGGQGRRSAAGSPPSPPSTCGCSACCSTATACRSRAGRRRGARQPRSLRRVAGEQAGRARPGLRRGDIVLAGPLHRMVPVRPGDVFQAEFAHLGTVTVQFAAGARHERRVGDPAKRRHGRHRHRCAPDRGRPHPRADRPRTHPAVHAKDALPPRRHRLQGAGACSSSTACRPASRSSARSWA